MGICHGPNYGPGSGKSHRICGRRYGGQRRVCREFKAQELSNTAWGVATILSNKSNNTQCTGGWPVLDILRQVARAIAERADEFQITGTLQHGVGLCDLGIWCRQQASASARMITFLGRRKTQRAIGQLMSRALDAVAKSALPRLKVFRSQELNNLAWAFARLERTDSTELYAGIGRELSQMRRHVTGQVCISSDSIARHCMRRVLMENVFLHL